MNAIPPVEPTRPSHAARLVRRRTPEEDQESPGHDEQPSDERFSDDEPEDDDGGLPHVDVRV